MADSKEKLFSEFPPVTTQQWMDRITADLKGADFEKKLVWKTNEGFQVKPFYRAEDLEGMKITDSLPGEFPFVRGTKTDNNWLVRQDIEVSDPKKANETALEILNKGIDSLCFILHDDLISAETMGILLKGICLECIEINFRSCSTEAAKIAGLLADYVKAHNLDATKIVGSVNYDPFKRMLTKGFDAENAVIVEAMKATLKAADTLPKFSVFGANPYLFNNTGAYCAQELGFGMAYGNEFLALASEAGLSVKEVAKKVKFNFGIGSNYFMEIAKFRAARLLWAQIVNAYLDEDGCKCAAKMHIHASTSEFNQSVYDAYVNLLRSQTEAMSATIAGVDSLTVIPFDASYQKSDDFSQRIARNQQLLLKEESHFDQIVDASAGSYYIENLTSALAEEAWKIFLAVDEKDGFLNAIREGFVQAEVNASNKKRLTDVSSRREILLGTNQYPNFNEFAKSKVAEKKTGCCCYEKGSLATLSCDRGSSAFDQLRLATENSGKRPKVFMLTIGSLSMRLARAQFSGNFFGCAGYELFDNLGFETAEEGVKAARSIDADIIVLCSSDDEYAEFAPAANAAIGTGKEILVVAGAPANMDELKAQGITNFINVRSNVLQTLQGFNQQLGIL
ncbi:MAG TPA: methylmalonyl-CoA mutase small subunit [Bacteroidales bacterium]|nr:methylmalonyl-CoA mutase small subunit [Bacteroidales bacterium]